MSGGKNCYPKRDVLINKYMAEGYEAYSGKQGNRRE